MGGIKFAWLAVWFLSPDWRSRKRQVCDFFQQLRWNRRAYRRGLRAVPRISIVYPGICLTTKENNGKHQSGYAKAARPISVDRHSFSRLVLLERRPRKACLPLPPLAFASDEGVNPLSA